MPPEPVDLLIEARWVLPMAPVNTVFADHAVAVASGRIVALGPIEQMNTRFEPRERVVRRGHALLPGFVNAYTRAPMTLFRGLRSRAMASTSPDFVREGTQLAIAEMLRAGITSFADMYSFPEEVARAASAARMRAAIGLPVADSTGFWAQGATAHFEKAEQLWDEYKSDPWVCLYFAPHESAELSDPTLIRLRRVADELDARVAMLNPPLERMYSLGLLRPGFTAIGLRDADSELIGTTGICVVVSVQSDLRLGSSALSVSKPSISMLDSQHVTVGFGTGDPADVGALDILAEARTAALFDNKLRAEDSLRIATIGGATALGFGGVTGSIEPGKYADLVCIDLNRLACQPISRVPDAILFNATREQVSDVWTSGRAAVNGGRLLAFDEQELSAIANRWSQT